MRILICFLILFFSVKTFSQTSDTRGMTYRPTFHFAPVKNWTNDPNGLVYYKGYYHLYFQYNPFADKWGHMSWAHATSKDLMKWEETAVAIPEYKNADGTTTMIFSGTAIVDSFNTSGFGSKKNSSPLIAIYTANIESNGAGVSQHQNIAYSFNGTNFIAYNKNPVLDINAKDFRDPKVFWYEPEKKWVMIVSKPDAYKVLFYSSADLKTWAFMSEFGNVGNQEKVWECPDIFEIQAKNSKEKKWVITLSAGHPEKGYLAMQYFIGYFNGNSFKADSLGYPLYLDYGKDFYAGITYNNLPSTNKRRIMIGWANSWEYANDIPTKGFRGMMAIPRSLTLSGTQDKYILLQQPVEEMKRYRGNIVLEKKSISVNDKKNIIATVKGDALDIEFEISKSNSEKSGIKVFKHGGEETLIYFDKNDNSVKIDRTGSGNVNFNKRFSSVESVKISSNKQSLKFRILIDQSIIEVFINDGEQVITDLVFPTKQNGEVEFFASSKKIIQFKNVKIWKMNPSMQ